MPELSSPVLGIVGGGQLARMTIQAASSLGIATHLFAATDDTAAPALAPHTTRGDVTCVEELARFARSCSVVTFDHENVPPEVVARLEADGHDIRPGARTLRFSNKAYQRQMLARHVPVPAFTIADSPRELSLQVSRAQGRGVVVKTACGGYDGKGVFVVEDHRDLASIPRGGDQRLVVEERLTIEQELSVLVARRAEGETVVYEPAETLQVDGVCNEVVAPARVSRAVAAEAVRVARTVADVVDAVGILAVELFVVGGRVLLNEVAPRPHNSGHYTIEGTVASQFENHVRAVLDLPLGSAALRAPAVAMVNVLGPEDGSDPARRLAAALAVPGAHVHLYGKSPRPGRKLGHVTVSAGTPGEALHLARRAAAALTSDPPALATRGAPPR